VGELFGDVTSTSLLSVNGNTIASENYPIHIASTHLFLADSCSQNTDFMTSDEQGQTRLTAAHNQASHLLRELLLTFLGNLRMLELTTPVQYVKGIGPRLAEVLGHKGIATAGELL
jgi:hypothetical protein